TFPLTGPIWSRDSRYIIYRSNQDGPFNLYEKQVSGGGEEKLLLKTGEDKNQTSVSSDGRFLLFDSGQRKDLWLLPLRDGDKAVPLRQTQFNESDGQFSPDSRWIAYQSDETGRSEIYVQVFNASSPMTFSSSEKWLVSQAGGNHPRWRADGKELFYQSSDDKMVAVPVTGDSTFRAGTPTALFSLPPNAFTWEPAPDGKRFLFLVPAGDAAQAPFTVLLNWP